MAGTSHRPDCRLRWAKGDRAIPVQHRIDKPLRVVYSTATGRLTEDELRGHQRRVRADPDFDTDLWQLYNYKDADLSGVSSECIEALLDSTLFSTTARSAVVVGSQLAPGVARTFNGFCRRTGKNIRVFRDTAPALTWLELD